VRGGLNGGVDVGHSLVVGAVGRAGSVRGGLCGSVSVSKLRDGCCIGRCARVFGGLGEDVGRWQVRLGGVGCWRGRVYWGLGGGVGVSQRQVGGVGGRAGRVRGFSAGVLAIAEENSAALVVSVGGCTGGCVEVPQFDKGRIAAPMNDVTGGGGGGGGVSALGTVSLTVLGSVLGRCAKASVVLSVLVECWAVVILVSVRAARCGTLRHEGATQRRLWSVRAGTRGARRRCAAMEMAALRH